MHKIRAPLKEAAVLDIGCGTGGAIPHFDNNNDYTGLDLSYSMLRQAAKKARVKGFHKYTLVDGNAEELTFADGSYDLVLIDTALHMIIVVDIKGLNANSVYLALYPGCERCTRYFR